MRSAFHSKDELMIRRHGITGLRAADNDAAGRSPARIVTSYMRSEMPR
jgi:hypothetical protein